MAFGDGTWDIEINIPVTQTDKISNLIGNKTSWCFKQEFGVKWMEGSGGFSLEYPVFSYSPNI